MYTICVRELIKIYDIRTYYDLIKIYLDEFVEQVQSEMISSAFSVRERLDLLVISVNIIKRYVNI